MSLDTIDVVMLTKNSNKPYFKRVLNAIAREIPLNRLIIVDGFSSDGTPDVVKRIFGEKAIIVRDGGTPGCARYIGMRLVKTEWFAFIDSDVEILPGWWSRARKYMRLPRVYGIQGVWDKQHNTLVALHMVRPLRGVSKLSIILHGFYRFGGADFGHVILRRKVLQLLDPCVLCALKGGEDIYIAQQIVKNNYNFIIAHDLVAIHYGHISIEKVYRQLMGPSGLLLEIDPFTAILYNLARIMSIRNKSAWLNMLQLLSVPNSYTKTYFVKKSCKRPSL